ncbi:MAG: hypothetical protein ACR2KX_13975 [Chitinophagaceae bacterium]
MKVDFNPFFSRASEYIDQDNRYIRLFSPEVLTIFNPSQIWNTVNILRSSPGGGKTTLLKLFTPRILKAVEKSKEEKSVFGEHCRRIYESLNELNVFDGDELLVIGSLLSFNNEYASLEYLKIDQGQKIRLFNSLLNVRIILSVLQSISIAFEFPFPEGLDNVELQVSNSNLIPTPLRNLKNGADLYNWACNQEEIIAKEIDAIFPIKNDEIIKVDDLYAFHLFSPGNVIISNKSITQRFLVMLDDVHNLSLNQREYFLKKIVDQRPLVNIWISERFKALTMNEIFSEGNTIGRDVFNIELENFWADKSNYAKFERFAKAVANKRVELALIEDRREFASFLLEKVEYSNDEVQTIISIINNKIKEQYGNERYKAILETRKTEGDLLNQLLELRSLEILLFRDKNKMQQTLDFAEELSAEELEEKEGSDVKNAARLFVNYIYKIPYYYGISSVCRLASFNIEQFLFISGNLFEEVKSNAIKKISNKNTLVEISANKQESVIRKLCETKWKELSIKVPDYEDVYKFLNSIGEFCQNQTYTPNAWNSPGLNGIAISMLDRKHLRDIIVNNPNHPYYRLAKIISICISYNLVDVRLNYKCKGDQWMLIYLNRLFCVHFNLPLHNGKFKEQKLTELFSWVSRGYAKKEIKLQI